ncbi:hypothetical protein BDV36DRAFT_309648 [Aspergillus pseudocaelatus]|uniref:Uncharacterized protein n=1 Tax=Aspergillus pseudocaelatus TaxID=1825620 RepID=A0ABQ6WJ49_9EURO|nr:hypothetical protein BDV36DRAFT_309648 [Aspergillus pseudocaelatus]
MATEVLITINSLGNVACFNVDPVISATTEIPLDDIRQALSTHVFVFRDPNELKKIFENTIPENVETRNGMRKLRLRILRPISSKQLTLEEKYGSIKGPNMSILEKRWRTACKAIPKKHEIEEIIFEMSCDQEIELLHISTLLQHISTTMSLKARGTFHCQVQGCDSKSVEWLKKSLVGVCAS